MNEIKHGLPSHEYFKSSMTMSCCETLAEFIQSFICIYNNNNNKSPYRSRYMVHRQCSDIDTEPHIDTEPQN